MEQRLTDGETRLFSATNTGGNIMQAKWVSVAREKSMYDNRVDYPKQFFALLKINKSDLTK